MRLQLPAAVVPALRFEVLECVPASASVDRWLGYTMSLVEQQLGSASLEDGTAIRFAVAGRGPVAIYVPGWVSHLELGWALPAERQFYEGLADGRTLVRYDRPGCGLSGTNQPHGRRRAGVGGAARGRDRGRC